MNLRLALAGSALCLLASGPASALVLQVPGAHATIQGAVNAAASGDTIALTHQCACGR